MSEKIREKKIELRSEEVQDILERAPIWMIRWGNSLLISLILMGVVLSYLIEYSDTIEGTAIISTATPPIYVSSNVTGYIGPIHAYNGQQVSKGEIIAEIANPVTLSSINELKSFLLSTEAFLKDKNEKDFLSYGQLSLYEASSDYLKLRNTMNDYYDFLSSARYEQELKNKQGKLQNYREIEEIRKKELDLSNRNLEFAEEQFQIQKRKYEENLISRLEYIIESTRYNESMKVHESIKRMILQEQLMISEFESEIQVLIYNHQEEHNAYLVNIEELKNTLQNYILRWEKDFTIQSPSFGTLTFMERVKESQKVSTDDELFAIIPASEVLEVVLKIPVTGFGKIKIGQIVRLKVDKFPSDQFGVLTGRVTALSRLPKGDSYAIKVELLNGLLTNLNLNLEYSPEMTASAEVITDKLRLFDRLFSSLKGAL